MERVDPVASVSPYPTIVDPFKRRSAVREYFQGLRGDNKENERMDADSKSPSGLPKQKTLGLCRRHTLPAVASTGDKRKFNAPRQTPEKRQRPDAAEDAVVSQFPSREEHVDLEPAVSRDEARRPQLMYARAKGATSSFNHQASQDSQSFTFKQQEPKTPTIRQQEPKISSIRKPLTPVNMNRQTSQVHSPPMPLKLNFSAGMEQEGSGPGESLFQLASGKRFQPSAAAKARAAALLELDEAELAGLLDFDAE
jgi:hypothetical protein